MSKKPWSKHENVEKEIIKILKIMGMATVNVILFELRKSNQISYGSIKRRLESLEEEGLIEYLKIGANQKIWKINNLE